MSENVGTDGTTIFQDQPGTTTVAPTTPASSSPPFVLPDEAKDFVGEGKKYATIEDALKSVPHAQKFIDEQKNRLTELEAETLRLKEELSQKKQMEDYLESLKQTQLVGTPPPAVPDLDSLLDQKLSERERNQKAQMNLLAVDSEMKKHYGEKAKDIFATKAQELGISINDLTKLAATSPNAFYKMFELKPNAALGTKTATSINTDGLGSTVQPTPSARVGKVGATTKDLVTAWDNAKPKEN
jgi:hypothetical protein